ncbi:MAG: NUDIX domain-containing protein [Abditibacteriales bacterium]|nr:NUDIX domain-containing protein [Abditibacteriales bacterium]
MIDDTWYHRPPDVPDRTSAGGVVVRRQDGRVYVALVQEGDLPAYVLPKGGIEKGEDLEETARREIAEEAGLSNLTLVAKLGTRERLSYDRQEWITAHYFLFVTDQVDGTPTDRETAYRLHWFPLDDLPPMCWREQRELIETNRERIVELVERRRPVGTWQAGSLRSGGER